MDYFRKYEGLCQYCGEPLEEEFYTLHQSRTGEMIYPVHFWCEEMIKVEDNLNQVEHTT